MSENRVSAMIGVLNIQRSVMCLTLQGLEWVGDAKQGIKFILVSLV